MSQINRRQFLATCAALPAVAAGSDEYHKDIYILREALNLHPGLYRYSTAAELDARITVLERAYVTAPSLDARYLALSRFLATIRCGHSYCNFYNQRKAIRAALFERRSRLPFYFQWIDRRMIVVADPAGLGLKPGTEVIAINNVPASEMLATLLPYARADGHNDEKRIALLGVTGTDSIEYFDVFHGLVYGEPSKGVHRVTLRLPTGGRARRELPAIDLATRQAQMPKHNYRGSEPVWSWAIGTDSIARLSMPSWALYDSKWEWRAWLSARLSEAQSTRGLIIDLRDNEGGEDCGDAILAHLTDRPITEAGAERLVRFERTPAALDPYLDTWDNSFRTLGVGAQPLSNGFRRLIGERGDDTIAPAKPLLHLPVVALIGPSNSSATFQFAAKAKRTGLVRLFGEPTGGNQRGINGGCFFFVHLPGSGIEFDLPLIGTFPAGSPPDCGIAPDTSVARNRRDIVSGIDRTMVTATEWIRSRAPI